MVRFRGLVGFCGVCLDAVVVILSSEFRHFKLLLSICLVYCPLYR